MVEINWDIFAGRLVSASAMLFTGLVPDAWMAAAAAFGQPHARGLRELGRIDSTHEAISSHIPAADNGNQRRRALRFNRSPDATLCHRSRCQRRDKGHRLIWIKAGMCISRTFEKQCTVCQGELDQTGCSLAGACRNFSTDALFASLVCSRLIYGQGTR